VQGTGFVPPDREMPGTLSSMTPYISFDDGVTDPLARHKLSANSTGEGFLMRTVQYLLCASFLSFGLGLAASVAQADVARNEMRCDVLLHHRSTTDGLASSSDAFDSSAEIAVSLGNEKFSSWSTAVILGKDPIWFTIGLSATTDSPDMLEAEIAKGKQPAMAAGPGNAEPGTLLETTRVRVDGNVQLIFDVPSVGVEVVCYPLG